MMKMTRAEQLAHNKVVIGRVIQLVQDSKSFAPHLTNP
jgi:hypothetical protein